MNVDSQKPRFARRFILLGVSALLGTAGVGTYLAVSAGSVGATHLSRTAVQAHTARHVAAAPAKAAPVVAAPVATAADGDNIQLQQGDQSGQDQSGQQDNSGGPDTSTGSTGESTGSETDAAGGHADAAGSAGQQGNFNNYSSGRRAGRALEPRPARTAGKGFPARLLAISGATR
jgi:hypothetical protein